jgi:hypothetical protein
MSKALASSNSTTKKKKKELFLSDKEDIRKGVKRWR